MAIRFRSRRERSDEPDSRRSDWLRAARILTLQSRRQASGPLTGQYASAFRGGGMVFEESRPYVPGDDVRRMDWNAMARTGQPYVKHFHEERDRTVEIVLDVSASMAFRAGSTNPAHVAAHVAALLAAAGLRAGDRIGIVTIDETARRWLRPARGPAHVGRVVEAVSRGARRAHGGADVDAGLEVLEREAETGRIVFVISDFRPATSERAAPIAAPRRLAGLAARNELVCIVIEDPRDRALPDVGSFRITDPERPGKTWLVASGDRATRTRYTARGLERRRALERALRQAGSDVVFLRTDRDPLTGLVHFFGERTARTRTRPA